MDLCGPDKENMPNWFKIKTPLGSYNPDWAVVIDNEGQESIYFVVETKGNILGQSLRATERAKIQCGHEHFSSLGVQFIATDKFADMVDRADT